MKSFFLITLLWALSLMAHAEWSLGHYHGYPYAGVHGSQDGASRFAVGMLCHGKAGRPGYVLAHRRFVTAAGPGVTLPTQFESGEVMREFLIDGVPFGDTGARHGVHDEQNHLLILASVVSVDSPIVAAIRQGRTLEIMYLNKDGERLYRSDFSLRGSAAAMHQVTCPG